MLYQWITYEVQGVCLYYKYMSDQAFMTLRVQLLNIVIKYLNIVSGNIYASELQPGGIGQHVYSGCKLLALSQTHWTFHCYVDRTFR